MIEDFLEASWIIKKARAKTIYKSMIKRFINIYQPNFFKETAITDTSKARKMFEDKKTEEERRTLMIISDFLKREKIDNMSFFI